MFRRFVIFAVAILALADVPAVADSEATPTSYTKPTPDGLHLFVMISRYDKAPEIRNSRSTYTQSGLYRNDGSSTPIWTVDWYADNVEPLSDGVHLVRPSPWVYSSNSEAVAFFAKGKLIRSYTVRDLVAYSDLMPHSVYRFEWRSYKHLNDQEKTYTIETKHGERYTFDVTTGDISSSFSPPSSFSPIRWILAVAIILVVSTLGYWWRRKQHA